MSKKQKQGTKTTKTTKKTKAKAATPRSAKAATKAAGESRGQRKTADGGVDPRIPPVGTVIQKLDRHGSVRCECKVEADGFRYNGQLYSSLSAAAMAAATDLGLENKTQNGFTFWGLEKRAGDPVGMLKQASDVFGRKAKAAITGRVTDDNRESLATSLAQHAEMIDALRESLAA